MKIILKSENYVKFDFSTIVKFVKSLMKEIINRTIQTSIFSMDFFEVNSNPPPEKMNSTRWEQFWARFKVLSNVGSKVASKVRLRSTTKVVPRELLSRTLWIFYLWVKVHVRRILLLIHSFIKILSSEVYKWRLFWKVRIMWNLIFPQSSNLSNL